MIMAMISLRGRSRQPTL